MLDRASVRAQVAIGMTDRLANFGLDLRAILERFIKADGGPVHRVTKGHIGAKTPFDPHGATGGQNLFLEELEDALAVFRAPGPPVFFSVMT